MMYSSHSRARARGMRARGRGQLYINHLPVLLEAKFMSARRNNDRRNFGLGSSRETPYSQCRGSVLGYEVHLSTCLGNALGPTAPSCNFPRYGSVKEVRALTNSPPLWHMHAGCTHLFVACPRGALHSTPYWLLPGQRSDFSLAKIQAIVQGASGWALVPCIPFSVLVLRAGCLVSGRAAPWQVRSGLWLWRWLRARAALLRVVWLALAGPPTA